MAEDPETDWRRMFEGAVAGLAMIREAVESLGPTASLESREAVLKKRGPEPIHDAEAIVDALARVRKRLEALRVRPRSHDRAILRSRIMIEAA